MEPGVIIGLIVASMITLASMIVGWRVQGEVGAFLLGVGALLASALCIASTQLGLVLWGNKGGWIGLVIAILLTGCLAWIAGNRVIKGQSGRLAAGLWLGLCFFCICGYLAGGPVGLSTITLPALAVFWIGLFRISAYVLPLRDENRRPEFRLFPHSPSRRPQASLFPPRGWGAYVHAVRESQWSRAFRSLLTFAMGTNYPYYFVKGGEVECRVDGSPFSQFFAGPGLVYADCDQAGYLTDGSRVKGVLEPGLNVTGWSDLEPKPIDLRPQLRTFDVEALTKDGILIQVPISIVFRIHPGTRPSEQGRKNAKCEPETGRSFPFRRRAVYQIAAAEPVQRSSRRDKNEVRCEWNSELVPMIATRIFQDVVSNYDVNDLCAPLDPDQCPYSNITESMSRKLGQALVVYGIELLDGWLGNLRPLDEAVTQRRLDNWMTEWERQILQLISDGKAEHARQTEKARAQAELRILLKFSQIVPAGSVTDPASQTALILRFIDCMGEVVSESDSQWPLPENTRATLRRLRGEIERRCR